VQITILIILAIIFIIVGFLIGNIFPILSGFLNPNTIIRKEDTLEEQEEDEESIILPKDQIEELELGESSQPLPSAIAKETERETETSTQTSRQLLQNEELQPQLEEVEQIREPMTPHTEEDNQYTEEWGEQQGSSPLERLQIRLPKFEQPAVGLQDIMHVWRDNKTKELVVQLGERLVRSGEEITTVEQGELSKLLIDLNEWVGLETRLESMQQTIKEQDKELTPGATRDYSKGRFKIKADHEEKPNLINLFVRSFQADVNAPMPEGLVSIVSQIDAILQSKLEGTPYEDHGISLKDIPGEGMVFMVGLHKYSEISDIPDEGIQEIIKSAVNAWEIHIDEEDR
jgi:hypothetical protein